MCRSPSGKPQYKVKTYSIAGHAKLLEGGPEPPQMLSTSGPVRLARLHHSADDLVELTKHVSSSAFGETYSRIIDDTLESTEGLAHVLDEVQLSTHFTDYPYYTLGAVSSQLEQVAKVIGGRQSFENERDAFFVSSSIAWDSHDSSDENRRAAGRRVGVGHLWEGLNSALSSFVAEMKAQGMWESVTLVMCSALGREHTRLHMHTRRIRDARAYTLVTGHGL